jgi:hypothetical protein
MNFGEIWKAERRWVLNEGERERDKVLEFRNGFATICKKPENTAIRIYQLHYLLIHGLNLKMSLCHRL